MFGLPGRHEAPEHHMIPCPNGCGRQMPELRLHIDGTNGVCGQCNNARVFGQPGRDRRAPQKEKKNDAEQDQEVG